ncbi:phosphoribosyl-dephospho-CoA transferase, partial [Methylobacterium goesingense]
MRDFARHDLLTVAPAAWDALLAGRPDLDGIPHLVDWTARGWPVIVRRRVPGEDAALVP